MSLQIFSKPFFTNYIVHPRADELTSHDRKKALAASIALGVLTLGICHLVCGLAFRKKRVSVITEDKISISPITTTAQDIIRKMGKDRCTFSELIENDNLNGDELYALYSLAHLYGVSSDQSAQFLEKAANKGNAGALRAIANQKLREGNQMEGLHYLNQAADVNDNSWSSLQACHELILLLSERRPLPKEDQENILKRAKTLFDANVNVQSVQLSTCIGICVIGGIINDRITFYDIPTLKTFMEKAGDRVLNLEELNILAAERWKKD